MRRRRVARSFALVESEIAVTIALEMGEPGDCDPAVIEGLADHAHESRDGDGAEGIARGQGVEVVITRLPAGVLGITDGDTRIVASPRRSRALLVIVILHELAHILLRVSGVRATHSDVWRLALALAMPRRSVTGAVGDIAARCSVPWWAAKMRVSYLAEVFGNAA